MSHQQKASTGGRAEKRPKTLRILSIDGGGVRGIIPATILEYLEKELQKFDSTRVVKLADYFDLIVGTSTGGLITAMITIPRPPKDGEAPTHDTNIHPYTAAEVVKFYQDYAAKVFPSGKCECWAPVKEIPRTCHDLLWPRYNPENLEKLLKEYFCNRTLSEALTNVIIPSFDIKSQKPVFFSSWEPTLKAALVKDVCRGTTAAPTFFPPAYFTVPPTEDEKKEKEEDKKDKKDHTKKNPETPAVAEKLKFNMIDGGIAVNNPTHVGITQAQRYLSRWDTAKMPNPNPKQCLVLSLGAGRHETSYSATDAEKWGVVQWLRHHHDVPLLSSLENASADMVDYNLSMIFEDHESSKNYLRIQTTLPSGLSKLDDSANVEDLKTEADKLVSEDSTKKVSKIEIVGGLFDTTDTGETIRSALNR